MHVKASHLLIFVMAALIALIIWQLIVYAQTAPVAIQFPVMVAVIALIGTVWTGAITFAGLLLKDSVDRRNVILQTESNRRQAILQSESEKRLRMEVAIKAIELMSSVEAGSATAQEKREGAIFVIASLDQQRMALVLAEQFWISGSLSTGVIVQIVDQCLDTGDDSLREEAAKVLRRGQEKLAIAPDRLDFPNAVFHKWNPKWPILAKEELLRTLVGALLSKEFTFWKENVLNQVLFYLYKFFSDEVNVRLKFTAAMFAKTLGDAISPPPGRRFTVPDHDWLSFEEVSSSAERVMSEMGSPDHFAADYDSETAARMRAWGTKDAEHQ